MELGKEQNHAKKENIRLPLAVRGSKTTEDYRGRRKYRVSCPFVIKNKQAISYSLK